MDVTDVGYVLQLNAVDTGAAATQRLTLHHFNNIDPVMPPHNSDARISDSAEWPSDLLRCFLLRCFLWLCCPQTTGDPSFIALLRGRIADTIIGRGRGRGGGGGRGRGARGDRGESGSGSGVTTRAMAKAQARTADTQADYAGMVLALWTQNARKHQHQVEVKKADRIRDEVQKWLDSPQNQL